MKINIRKSAIKDLKNIDSKERAKIHQKILTLSNFPKVVNVKKLTSFEPAFRLRVRDCRILFDVTENSIEIGRIIHRKESNK